MADTSADAATGADAAAERAAEQAQRRKERREAKIRAGGSARLDKITGLGGRVPAADVDFTPPASTTASGPAPGASPPHSGDPEEVDISQHFYAPGRTPRVPPGGPAVSDEQLRQMMLGFDHGGMPGPQQPGPGGMPMPGDDDPMMKMMAQMMAGAGGPGGAGMPPFPGMPGAQEPALPDRSTALFRVLHAAVALGLGLYIAVLTPFAGTRVERERAAIARDPLAADDDEHRRRLFFWTFATAEVGLLTVRFYLDGGRGGSALSGIVGTAVGFIPEPLKGYVKVVMRYGQIFSTVRADILTCIFVLGVCSWWRD